MRIAIWTTVLVLALEGAASAPPSGTWAIDPERSSVRFTVTKFGREVVEGRFRQFAGAVVYDPQRPERSALRWSVRVASVETGEPERDRQLRGPQFFHAARFQKMTFVASRIRPLPDGRVHLTGTITIRGMSRPLVIIARPLNGDRERPLFESQFVLNRHDFGVSGGSVSRHGISDEVRVHLRMAGVPR
ncbi:MAG TPA: YceI family protein [Thermoanaerobaculia bacterium]|nr:YceI family protein [Thermoanaerobaculia bacterium]